MAFGHRRLTVSIFVIKKRPKLSDRLLQMNSDDRRIITALVLVLVFRNLLSMFDIYVTVGIFNPRNHHGSNENLMTF